MGVARVAWRFDIVGICPHHDISLDLALLILGDLAFPGTLPSLQGDPGLSLL